MVVFIIMILILIVAVFGAPLFSVIGLTALVNFQTSGVGILVVPQEFSRLANMQMIHSIPIFTFAGYLLAASKASTRLVRFTKAALGWMPGGLAIVTILVSAFFTAFTGASGVTIVALGGFLLPALLSEKYDEEFSLGLVTTSGSIGLLIPPSLPIIIYGVVAQVKIESLFVAGILPEMLLLSLLCVFVAFKAKQFKVARTPFNFSEFKAAFWEIKWELPLPILLFAGIYSGKLAMSDAAAFTAVYIFVVEVLIHRDVKLQWIPDIMKKSMVLVGAILIIMGVSLAATNFIIDQEVPQKIFNAIKGVISNKYVFLILLNIFLLVVGCIMDIFSALVVVIPLILPIAQAYNVDMVHLGIIFLVNLNIGYLTPPVGMNLFISSIRFNKPIVTLYKASLIFIGLLLGALLIITYVPNLSLWFFEKPAVQGLWEYNIKGSDKVDRLVLKAGGKYVRKQGSPLELMMKTPVYGDYRIKGNKLTLSADGTEEKYKFEIFKNGQELRLTTLDDAPTPGTDGTADTNGSESDDFLEEDDFLAEDDFLEDDFLAEDNVVINEKERIYINKAGTPLTRKYGRLIGKWADDSLEIEFYINGTALVIENDLEETFEYEIKGGKIQLLVEKKLEKSYKYSVKNDILTLKEKDQKRTLTLQDSLSDK